MSMTVSAFQINEVMRLYNRLSKLKPGALLEHEQDEQQDVVRISAEAKKRQVLDQTKTDVLARIRNT
jgi:hypothetical protein